MKRWPNIDPGERTGELIHYRFGLKTSTDFDHCGLKLGVVFKGTMTATQYAARFSQLFCSRKKD